MVELLIAIRRYTAWQQSPQYKRHATISSKFRQAIGVEIAKLQNQPSLSDDLAAKLTTLREQLHESLTDEPAAVKQIAAIAEQFVLQLPESLQRRLAEPEPEQSNLPAETGDFIPTEFSSPPEARNPYPGSLPRRNHDG